LRGRRPQVDQRAVYVRGDLLAQVPGAHVGLARHSLLFGEAALAPPPIQHGQRHLYGDRARGHRLGKLIAAPAIVRRQPDARQALRRNRGRSGARGAAAGDFSGEIRSRFDRLRDRGVTIARNRSRTELHAQRVGELDRRCGIETQRAREIDPGALELALGQDQPGCRFGQLHPGAGHVDRRGHPGPLLRDRERDELVGER